LDFGNLKSDALKSVIFLVGGIFKSNDKLGLKIIYQVKDKTFRYFFEYWDSGYQNMLELGRKIEILIIQIWTVYD
jgi:hypothetical protein